MKRVFEIIFSHYIRIIVSFLITILFVVLFNSFNNSWSSISGYSDGLFLGGFFNVLLGGLVLVSSQGTFNIFSYYFQRKTIGKSHKENYTEYCERKATENKKYTEVCLPYFFVGLISIIISLIFLFL